MNGLITAGEAQMARQAQTDTEVLKLWVRGRSPHTHDVAAFMAWVRRPLATVTIRDVQGFFDSLADLADASRGRMLAAVKSLLSFAQRIGYIPFNVGVAVDLPKTKDKLAERILDEEDVLRMIHREQKPRNHALLRLLYVAGARVSEVCALCWRDVQPTVEGTGQITVYGKGGKTRAIRLTRACWVCLQRIHDASGPDDPVWPGLVRCRWPTTACCFSTNSPSSRATCSSCCASRSRTVQ